MCSFGCYMLSTNKNASHARSHFIHIIFILFVDNFEMMLKTHYICGGMEMFTNPFSPVVRRHSQTLSHTSSYEEHLNGAHCPMENPLVAFDFLQNTIISPFECVARAILHWRLWILCERVHWNITAAAAVRRPKVHEMHIFKHWLKINWHTQMEFELWFSGCLKSSPEPIARIFNVITAKCHSSAMLIHPIPAIYRMLIIRG